MDWFKELKIAHKLYLQVAIASFFILLTSIIGYSFNAKASKSLDIMYNENLVAIEALGDVRGNVMRALADSLRLMQNTTPQEGVFLVEDINKMKSDTAELFQKYLDTNPTAEAREKFNDLKKVRIEFWKNMDKATVLAKANKNAQAYAIYKANLENEKIYRSTLL